MNVDKVFVWCGRRVDEMTRDELLQVINELAEMWRQEQERAIRAERGRMEDALAAARRRLGGEHS